MMVISSPTLHNDTLYVYIFNQIKPTLLEEVGNGFISSVIISTLTTLWRQRPTVDRKNCY